MAKALVDLPRVQRLLAPLLVRISYPGLRPQDVQPAAPTQRRVQPLLCPALGSSLLLLSSVALSSAPYEDEPAQATVRYAGGDRLSVRCDSESCQIKARAAGERFRLDLRQDQLPGRLIPRSLVLFSKNTAPGTLSFESEIECESYAEAGPSFHCVASVVIADGRDIKVHLRRVYEGREEYLQTLRIAR